MISLADPLRVGLSWESRLRMLFVSGKMFVLFGAVLLIIGGIALLLAKFGVHRVPGDIVLKRGGVTFFFPIVSCIILSVVLSLVMALFRRR